ncbi:alanine-glyoxylate transaminase/serine-glyoxylate transaminase/serine-pyruvate transaminase [Roseibium hamelinense]|uniref:Alanine-glyoxylate transaminase/serine-glyoxylate transaminase/serine-pyruvate transaminase n=1 Tax=Roseibium hamelinense TaxID=150831 RepID=A0A562T1Z6_9HYPH|nr:aminotransferase class V-fold PLP-dependent enzyme [Roseibium hamelinense]MTI44713.1 aminotransferase class V-fold PLP-dependent enzyme [Roseibium hamelinense]TWI87343.1 alanine-glyoxylate transaminase/serine-glyoxylate transaminase/serine-pyruvate transaminase [Roseibium hamelinense]
MTLSNGKEFLMIPGPTNIPDTVLQAMHRPAIDIYEGPLVETTDACMAGLKRLFRTEAPVYIYAANGHGAWDAALTNTLNRGDTVLVLESGLFAHAWGEAARVLGLNVDRVEGTWRSAVDPNVVEQQLRQDADHKIKAVLMVQVDTASGVWNDVKAVRAAIDAAGHPALFMVDTIASLGCMPFEMDAWGVDIALTGSQKGLMSPPGLSFVAAGPKAVEAHASANLKNNYMDWTFRNGEIHYQKYCGTPPEHLLFAFRAALDLLFQEGLEQVWHRHALLAEATRHALGVWSEAGSIDFNIINPHARSNSVTVATFDEIDPEPLRNFTKDVCGVTIGGMIGPIVGKGIRIGHMGHVNAVMVLGTLSAVELGLKKLGIPHNSGGLQAAIDYLDKAL